VENTATSIWQSRGEVADYDELETETCQMIGRSVAGADPVLDVGCGEGKLANFLGCRLHKGRQGRKVLGVELLYVSGNRVYITRSGFWQSGHGICAWRRCPGLFAEG